MTPLEIVTTYYDNVWSGKDVDRLDELCAEPVLRHDPKGDVPLTRAEQRERILKTLPLGLRFRFLIAHGNDEYASVVWEADNDAGDRHAAGIQTFRIANGQIAEVWNATRETNWTQG
jgi:predicted SnoaL-like aldol condensation-catalyzing enzyme